MKELSLKREQTSEGVMWVGKAEEIKGESEEEKSQSQPEKEGACCWALDEQEERKKKETRRVGQGCSITPVDGQMDRA